MEEARISVGESRELEIVGFFLMDLWCVVDWELCPVYGVKSLFRKIVVHWQIKKKEEYSFLFFSLFACLFLFLFFLFFFLCFYVNFGIFIKREKKKRKINFIFNFWNYKIQNKYKYIKNQSKLWTKNILEICKYTFVLIETILGL